MRGWYKVGGVLAMVGIFSASAQEALPAQNMSLDEVLTPGEGETPVPLPPVTVKPMEPVGRVIPLSLTLSGGTSLGAYQAGFVWSTLMYLRRHRAVLSQDGSTFLEEQPYRDPYLGQAFHIESLAGTSAGSGNALASALLWCADDARDYPLWDNVLWESWRTFDLEKLLPEDVAVYRENDGLFSTRGLEEGLEVLRHHLEATDKRDHCQVPVGFSVTRNTPSQIQLSGNVQVPTSKYVVPLLFHTEDDGRLLIDDLRLRQENLLGKEVIFPHLEGEHIPVDSVLATVLGSAAIPGVFTAARLKFCGEAPEGLSVEPVPGCPEDAPALIEDDFVDGGAFDRLPLGLGIALARSVGAPWTPDSPEPILYLTLDPQVVRFANPPKEQGSATAQGLMSLAAFTSDFFMVARQYELQTLARQGQLDGEQEILWETRRAFPVMGRYIGNFGAFVDPGFREFDYLVGVYDGLIHMATLGYLQRVRMDPATFGLPRLDPLAGFDCGDPAGTEEPYGAKVLVCSLPHLSDLAREVGIGAEPQVAAVVGRLLRWELMQVLGPEAYIAVAAQLPAWPLGAADATPTSRALRVMEVLEQLEEERGDLRWSNSPSAFVAVLDRLVKSGYPFTNRAILRDPEGYLYAVARRGFNRLEMMERASGSGERTLGQKITIGAVRAASAALPTNTSASTGLSKDRGGSMTTLIPNYVDLNLLRGGLNIGYESWSFGWQKATVSLTAEPITWQRTEGIHWQASVEAGWQRQGLTRFSGARGGFYIEGPYLGLIPDEIAMGTRLSAQFLASRAQVGIEIPLWEFDPAPEFNPTLARQLEITLGILDVRGFVRVGRGR